VHIGRYECARPGRMAALPCILINVYDGILSPVDDPSITWEFKPKSRGPATR